MRFSEAIRLGAMAILPVRGMWVRYKDDCYGGEVIAGCVYGTALYAVGVREFYDSAEQATARWPFLRNKVRCPETGYYYPLHALVHILYELCGWSRERVAAWVATVEPPEPSESVSERASEVTYVEA